MKVYLASTAPGNEDKKLTIKRRLLSFYHITHKQLEADKVFNKIKHENLSFRRKSKKTT